ncbi:uncharacterized protein LOC103939967 isoform X6 [Pyrus x bretschneideri]|uniref:uncharacterized protein LOC103939967 isoform X6 n=1 Tax=Pyrus x bretschneideri TaxID=225117 RepID=UPI00202F0C27|nr:uncharacterized protein LOC103939967 isoform X6 [Pyrus x bretschneideri]
MDFAELEKDTASRDEWLLMCRKQNVFSQMILIKDDIHYGQINSELGISFSHNMDDEFVFTTIQDTLEFITTKGQIFLPWKLLKLGTSLVSKLYIQLYLACSKLCLTGILSILHL